MVKTNFLKKTFILLLLFSVLFIVSACNNEKDSTTTTTNEQTTTTIEQTITTIEQTTTTTEQEEEVYDFSGDIADVDNWRVNNEDNAIIGTDRYITLKNGDSIAGYDVTGYNEGVLNLKIMTDFTTGNWGFIGFRVNGNVTDAPWSLTDAYGIFIQNNGTMTLEKWSGGVQTVLSSSTETFNNSLVFLDGQFHNVKIETKDVGDTVEISVSVDTTEVMSYVAEGDKVITGGKVNFMCSGATMVIGNHDAGEYTAPISSQFTPVVIIGVPEATTDLDLLSGGLDNWAGYTGPNNDGSDPHFNPLLNDDGSITFRPSPKTGIVQGLYKSALFSSVKHTVKFTTDQVGDWMLFSPKQVSETTNGACWGVNSNAEGQSDSYTFFINWKDNLIYLAKWQNGAQIILYSEQIPGELTFTDSTVDVHTLVMELVIGEKAGNPNIDIIVTIDGYTISASDSDDPYVNPGYFTLQGYGNTQLTIKEVVSKPN